MEQARSAWTDERLDDMARRMDDGFNRVDLDVRTLWADMNARFDAIDARFDAMYSRFDSLQRTMLQLGGGMIATFVVGFAGLLAAQL